MIIIIDNYDSFVHNLARYVINLGFEVKVFRNDKISVEEVERLNPSHIILSPGPCAPDQAGVCLDLVSYFYDKIPILGVCLGHQVIAQCFGAKVIKSDHYAHGVASIISHDGSGVFKGLPDLFQAGRYHSLVVSPDLAGDLKVCASLDEDSSVIMAIRHVKHPVFGVQFHPESILTDYGVELIKNFCLIEVDSLVVLGR
jgi:anthranilate synthase/aminodeoxychorismate synthase-like glutamine amidotransferase